jgi:hypothetical protein
MNNNFTELGNVVLMVLREKFGRILEDLPCAAEGSNLVRTRVLLTMQLYLERPGHEGFMINCGIVNGGGRRYSFVKLQNGVIVQLCAIIAAFSSGVESFYGIGLALAFDRDEDGSSSHPSCISHTRTMDHRSPFNTLTWSYTGSEFERVVFNIDDIMSAVDVKPFFLMEHLPNIEAPNQRDRFWYVDDFMVRTGSTAEDLYKTMTEPKENYLCLTNDPMDPFICRESSCPQAIPFMELIKSNETSGHFITQGGSLNAKKSKKSKKSKIIPVEN